MANTQPYAHVLDLIKLSELFRTAYKGSVNRIET